MSVQQSNDDNKYGKYGKYSKYFSFISLVLIVLLFSIFMRSEKIVTLNFNNDDEGNSISFTITTDSGDSTEITWDSITSAELRETLDFGVLVEGVDTKKEQSGTWKNEEFGEYSLYTDTSVDHYLVLHTEDGIVVLNLDSNETTDSLCDAVQKMI